MEMAMEKFNKNLNLPLPDGSNSKRFISERTANKPGYRGKNHLDGPLVFMMSKRPLGDPGERVHVEVPGITGVQHGKRCSCGAEARSKTKQNKKNRP